MNFEYLSDFLNHLKNLKVDVAIKEESYFYDEDEPTVTDDGLSILRYEHNILGLPYSEENSSTVHSAVESSSFYADTMVPDVGTVASSASSSSSSPIPIPDASLMSVEPTSLRLVEIINTLSTCGHVKDISLPGLSGDTGHWYGGGTDIGIDGNFYERGCREAFTKLLKVRNDIAIDFKIIVSGAGRMQQTCSFDKDIGADMAVYYIDGSNVSRMDEFSFGPFFPMAPGTPEYTINATKITFESTGMGYRDDSGSPDSDNSNEVVLGGAGGSGSSRVDEAADDGKKRKHNEVASTVSLDSVSRKKDEADVVGAHPKRKHKHKHKTGVSARVVNARHEAERVHAAATQSQVLTLEQEEVEIEEKVSKSKKIRRRHSLK